MKPILFIVFISCCLTSYSQVYKFKAYQSCLSRHSDKTIKESEWNNVDILIVINIDKKKINTYGEKEGDYDILKIESDEIMKDSTMMLTYSAIDEDGEKCKIYTFKYKDGKRTMVFEYPEIELAFRIRKNN